MPGCTSGHSTDIVGDAEDKEGHPCPMSSCSFRGPDDVFVICIIEQVSRSSKRLSGLDWALRLAGIMDSV